MLILVNWMKFPLYFSSSPSWFLFIIFKLPCCSFLLFSFSLSLSSSLYCPSSFRFPPPSMLVFQFAWNGILLFQICLLISRGFFKKKRRSEAMFGYFSYEKTDSPESIYFQNETSGLASQNVIYALKFKQVVMYRHQ